MLFQEHSKVDGVSFTEVVEDDHHVLEHQGMNDSSKYHELRRLVGLHNVNIIAILESRVRLGSKDHVIGKLGRN